MTGMRSCMPGTGTFRRGIRSGQTQRIHHHFDVPSSIAYPVMSNPQRITLYADSAMVRTPDSHLTE